MKLTVPDTMTLFVAIEANDLDSLNLGLIIGTVLGHMAILLAIVTLGQTSVDRLTCVGEAGSVLLGVFGPELCLARSSRTCIEAVRNLILLVQVTLKVHVGNCAKHGGLLNGNQVDSDVLVAECSLQVLVGNLGCGLDIALDTLLDIIKVSDVGALNNHLPGILGSDIHDIVTVNSTRVLAVYNRMTYREVIG